MHLPAEFAASAKAAQKRALGNSKALTTTARFRRMSPPTTATAMLSPRHRGSNSRLLATSCASMGSRDLQYATSRSSRAQRAFSALHATAKNSVEVAKDGDDGDDDDDSSPQSPSSSSSSSSSVPADLVEVATFGAPHGVRGEVRIFPVTDEPEERLLEGAEEGARFWVAPQVETGRGGGGRGGGILIGRGPSSSSAAAASAAAAAAAAKPRPVRIEAARPAPISRSGKKGSSGSLGSSSWLLKLRGIDSPEAAAALANTSLWMSAAERPALPETGDDYYAQELIGMEASLGGGGGGGAAGAGAEKVVGVVVDVCGGGGGTDLLRLELSDDEEEEEELQEEEELEFEEEEEEAAAAASRRRRRQQQQQQRKASTISISARRTVLLPFTRAFVPHVDRVSRKMTICPPDGLLDLAILPPKAQLKQQEQEAAALAAAAAAGAAGGERGGGLAEGVGGKKSRPRRPRGRKARDRAGGGTAAPPSA